MRSFWIRSMNPMELQIRGPVARPSIHFFGAFRWMPQKPRTHLNSFYSSNIMVFVDFVAFSHLCRFFLWRESLLLIVDMLLVTSPSAVLESETFLAGIPNFCCAPPPWSTCFTAELWFATTSFSLGTGRKPMKLTNWRGINVQYPAYYRVPSGYPSFDS